MMRILILEDNNQRIKGFQDLLGELENCVIYRATNIKAAIRWIREKSFDVLFLDHDLSPEHYGGDYSKTKSGHDLTKWLSRRPMELCNNKLYIIHSLNEDGSKNMLNELKKGVSMVKGFRDSYPVIKRIPFAWEKEGTLSLIKEVCK